MQNPLTTVSRNRALLLIAALCALTFLLGYLTKSMVTPLLPPQAMVEQNEPDNNGHADDTRHVIWTCSMHPQIRLPKAGQCPICFMDLIPIEQNTDTQTSLRAITLTPEARKLAEINVTPVRRLDVAVERRLEGKVDYDETRVRTITAWIDGRIERMYVDYTGDTVAKGQPMVSVYSPQLLTAQAELIQAALAVRDLENSTLDLVRKSAQRTETAAREKLRLLGLTQEQIKALLHGKAASDRITLHAPQSGVVTHKNVNEGQYVKTGMNIYSIADLSRLWVILNAYESDLPWIDRGRHVQFQTDAWPGTVFQGAVAYIDPLVNEKTRTIRVRLSVPNNDGRLKPGMLVRAIQKKPQSLKNVQAPLVIPASAPLITGKRAVVYVENPTTQGAFEGREIVLGPRAGQYYIVESGLTEGDMVVTKGNFKIDSAVQIMAGVSMMNPASDMRPVSEDISPLFSSKLRLLAQSFTDLSAIVKTGDLKKTHLAFGAFNTELRLIDASELKDDAALKWKELAMLLGNDAILGAEAPDTKRLHEIFAEMNDHDTQMRTAFKVDVLGRPSTPETFRKNLGAVFASYEPLANALAVDDLDGARQAVAQITTALQKVDAKPLEPGAREIWTKALGTINDGLEIMRKAANIDAMRTGFAPFSVGLSDAVLKLGAQTDSPVFEIFCPMAFDYKGATWLQRDEKVRNPYLGSAMPTCGEVNRQIQK